MIAWDGPWSPDLVNLFSPVAVEIEAKRELSWFRAAQAAIASVFSPKGGLGTSYVNDLKKVLDTVRAEQLGARGEEADQDRHSIAAQKLLDFVMKAEGFRRK